MDESEQAQQALEYALETFPEATLTVLHVSNPIEDSYFAGQEQFFTDTETLERRARERSETVLSTARSIAKQRDRSIETEMAMGPAARTIVEYVDEHAHDHVVIGSHGRAGMARILLGSVAETVARRSTVPVTIVK